LKVSIDFLKNIALFSTLSDEELSHFVKLLNPFEIPMKKTIFQEGDPGDKMYVVTKGKVGISVKIPENKELEIAEITEGNFFGEMSIFDNSPRSATCFTKEDSSLLSLSNEDFYNSIEENPQAAIKIMYKMVNIIAGRLNTIGALISDMVQWGEDARKRAITDEATGLYNRRFLEESLEERFIRAKEKNSPLSLVMVDLDHFSKFNKEYGQKIGDKAIKSICSIFKTIFREDDILARFGGDEFTFILNNTDHDKAYDLCNEVIKKINESKFLCLDGKNFNCITASIGIASFPTNADNLDVLKEKTDKALYKAKELGRNQVYIYKD
jgi:diguanylate cyclase (GGDEF)-like protein